MLCVMCRAFECIYCGCESSIHAYNGFFIHCFFAILLELFLFEFISIYVMTVFKYANKQNGKKIQRNATEFQKERERKRIECQVTNICHTLINHYLLKKFFLFWIIYTGAFFISFIPIQTKKKMTKITGENGKP